MTNSLADATLDRLCLAIVAVAAALVPLERGLFATQTPLNSYVPLAILGLAFAGRVAVPVAPVVWLSAIPLVGFAGFAHGMSGVLIAVPLVVLCGLGPFAVRGLVVRDGSVTKVAAVGFLAGQTSSALVGIAQYLGASPLGIEIPFGRSVGLAGHPNVLGLMAGIAIVVLLSSLLTSRRARMAKLAVLLPNGLAMVATGSLSAMMSTALAVVLLLWCRRAVSKAAVITVIAAVVTYVVAMQIPALSGLVDSIGYRFGVVTGSESQGGAASLDTRGLTYEWAWDYIRQSPVYGVGLEREAANTYNGISPVHNFFLRSWYQGGLTHAMWAGAVLVALTARVLLPALRQRRPDTGLPAAGVLLVLVFASTSAFFDQAQYWLPLLFFIAMVRPGGAQQDEVQRSDEVRPSMKNAARTSPGAR